MRIADRAIGYQTPPAFVAEISCNHCGSIKKAFELITLAKQAQADFVKFQCYEPDALTMPGLCHIDHGPWKGRDLYELYDEAKTPYAWFPEIAVECKRLAIPWFASVFDTRGIQALEYAGTCAYKIASCEIQDTHLIELAASTGKPVIVSTGMASRADIARALDVLARYSAHDPILLHCIAGYPSKPREAQLRTLEAIKEMTAMVGLSDHSTRHIVPVAATTMGVVMIEKHLRLSLTDDATRKSPDVQHSINAEQFYDMVQACNEIWLATRDQELRIDANITGSERDTLFVRRSLRAKTDIKVGEILTPENVTSLRPSGGLPPYEYEHILGRKAHENLKKGDPITDGSIGDEL